MTKGKHAEPSQPRITAGPWIIDPAARTVASEHGIRRIEPKPMALLLHLVAHVGEVVPRQDLLNAGWARWPL